ncbi:hypothetical protein [Geodermatophilus sp. DSM 45219]|uniref:hypothetical protein n=1 Tax=Geodermatophilus sp. DSM 45219 TaxID=1881103 RepID=UPI00087F0534|nr:hypothetical protein [Geodermatophilus sp. DSM 45219]SDN75344.1 hypothetical protein SAMN05428965_1464 [Geodermatophilus sp. DSM 45219]
MTPRAPRWTGDRRPRFPRTARLDAVGHAALGGACLAAAAGSALALRWTGRPPAVRAALGPVVVVTGLVALDRRRWAAMTTGLSSTDDAAATRVVADLLVARGLPVEVDEQRPGLRYAHRDARRVHAALQDLGVDTPDR